MAIYENTNRKARLGAPGDSGGSWSWKNNAHGIASGCRGRYVENGKSYCNLALVVPISALSKLGWEVVTG